jgi:hypothetical protein
MTIDYKADIMIDLRKYLWDQLEQNNIFTSTDYYSDNVGQEIVPIIPVQQSPEMNQFLSGKRHIVYDKIGMSYENNWMICCEQILLTLYSPDLLDIVEIRNFLTDEFRRMDESARDVNKWAGLSDKFKFHSIHIADISSTAPSEEIQGFYAADVILEVKYSRITNGQGRFA